MVNILRVFGVICSMIISAISLYSFTMFWAGLNDDIKHGDKTVKKQIQTAGIITPIQQPLQEKRYY